MDPELSKEHQILVVMRQVLASVVREITPEPGMRHPLTQKTMEDVKQCFNLIAAREREITQEVGMPSQHRPRYVDDQPKTNVVNLHRKPTDKNPEE